MNIVHVMCLNILLVKLNWVDHCELVTLITHFSTCSWRDLTALSRILLCIITHPCCQANHSEGYPGWALSSLRCSFSEARETNDKQWMCSWCNRFLVLPFMQERSQPVCVSSQVYHSAPPICWSGHSFPSTVWHYPVSIVSALTLFLQSANPMPFPCKDQSS